MHCVKKGAALTSGTFACHEARKSFLVVTACGRLAAQLARSLTPHGAVDVARSVHEALCLASPDGGWALALVAHRLPDGDAFSLLRALELRGASPPALVVAREASADLLGRAFEAEVAVLVEPVSGRVIRLAMERALTPVRPSSNILAVVADWGTIHSLTRGEIEILQEGIYETDRVAWAARRGVTPGTLKSEIHRLVQKTGDASLANAVRRVLRDVIGTKEPGVYPRVGDGR